MVTIKNAVAKPAGWTRTKEIRFLEHLALSCNVAESERVADVPVGSAYRLRRRKPEFHRAWELALRDGYKTLELAMLDRALNGVPVETVSKEGTVTKTRVYSDRLAVTLFNAHRATIARLDATDDAQGGKAELERLLQEMARRADEEQ